MKRYRNDRVTEGQGKSSKAPIFKAGLYNNSHVHVSLNAVVEGKEFMENNL